MLIKISGGFFLCLLKKLEIIPHKKWVGGNFSIKNIENCFTLFVFFIVPNDYQCNSSIWEKNGTNLILFSNHYFEMFICKQLKMDNRILIESSVLDGKLPFFGLSSALLVIDETFRFLWFISSDLNISLKRIRNIQVFVKKFSISIIIKIYRNDRHYCKYILFSSGGERILLKLFIKSKMIVFIGQQIIYFLLALLFFLSACRLHWIFCFLSVL